MISNSPANANARIRPASPDTSHDTAEATTGEALDALFDRLVADLLKGLLHAAEIAHLVVDDGDHGRR